MILAIPLLIWDLDATDGGFVSGGSTGQWEWGVPTVGPGGTARLWGTNLDGPYLNDAVDTLEIALPDTTTATRPVLVVEHWYDVRAGDAGVLELDDGTGWRVVDPIYGYPQTEGFTGTSSGFVRSSVELGGSPAGTRLRFAFASNTSFAGPGWFVRGVELWDGDATAPRVRPRAVVGDTEDTQGPYVVELTVVDDVGVGAVSVMASFDGAAPIEVPATWAGGDAWLAEIPGQPPGTAVEWYAVATDGELEGRWPVSGTSAFRVFLPAPFDLRGPGGRVVGHEVALEWRAPDALEPVVGYVVVEEGREDDPIEVTGTTASVPVDASGDHTWRVSAVSDAGVGDASEPLTLTVEVPTLHEVAPPSAWAGDRLRVHLAGESLYLLDGTSQVAFGDGVDVEELEIVDVNRATALVRVGADALSGPRAVTVSGPFGTSIFEDAFAVGDPAEQPRIVAVDPAKIEQGETLTIEIVASEAFFGDVVVDADGDLVVASDVVTDGTVARFDLIASGRASPGEHVIVLDDGRRLWTAEIEVTERILDPGRCQTGGTGVIGWAGVIGLLVRRRRGGVGHGDRAK